MRIKVGLHEVKQGRTVIQVDAGLQAPFPIGRQPQRFGPGSLPSSGEPFTKGILDQGGNGRLGFGRKLFYLRKQVVGDMDRGSHA